MHSTRKSWRKISWLILSFFLAVSAASAGGPAPADLKSLRLAHIDPPIEAPQLRLTDLNRKRVSLSEFKGKAVLLYFWASW